MKKNIKSYIWILNFNIILFLMSIIISNKILLVQIFGFNIYNSMIYSYQLITSMFIHTNILYLFINTLFMFFIGKLVEDYLKSFMFIFLYISSGVIGTVLKSIISPDLIIYGSTTSMFGIIIFYLLMNKNINLISFKLIELKMKHIIYIIFYFLFIYGIISLLNNNFEHMISLAYVGVTINSIIIFKYFNKRLYHDIA